jgi:hypothetical protein
MIMKDINEVFNITPDKLMGDKALSKAVGRINRRWLFMSMEDLEFIAKAMGDAFRIELTRKEELTKENL